MERINPKMVELARESRGYNQSELAALIGIPQGNLSRMERGDVQINEILMNKICEVLDYPVDFFKQTNRICTTDTHYRKAIVLDQKTKLKAEALMNIYKFNIEEMLKSLDLDFKNVPVLSDQNDTPEKIARYVRSYWKIPKGPIHNLSSVIEDNGVIVIQMDFESDKIEGRTIITETGHPIIFINKNSSGDRQRLTLAHELGHVILHLIAMPMFGTDEEEEAFRFGMEFLMPMSECQYDLNSKLSIDKLADLKRIWRVSMASILYRAQKDAIIDKNRARYLWSIISSRGWKKVEPIEIPKENPTLLNRMVNMFLNELEHSKEEIANLFKINVKDFDQKYFIQNTHKMRIA